MFFFIHFLFRLSVSLFFCSFLLLYYFYCLFFGSFLFVCSFIIFLCFMLLFFLLFSFLNTFVKICFLAQIGRPVFNRDPLCVNPAPTAAAGRNRFGSIRLGSVIFEKSLFRFGSVRKYDFPGSTRFGLRFLDASWLGPVRLGSVPRPVPAGSRIKCVGSVRPVRFGFSFLPVSSKAASARAAYFVANRHLL